MTQVNIHPSVRRAANMVILGDLSLAQGVEVGANVTFYPNVFVGENTRIFDGAVIGRPPIRAGTTNRPISRGDSTVHIGADCVIGANCVLYTHLRIGKNILIGDLTSIREGSQLEDEVVIGRANAVMHDVTIQARSRVTDLIHLTGCMHIEPDVFIGPGVTTMNDNDVYLKRFGLIPFNIQPPRIRRFAVIGSGASIGSDVEIGVGAVVAPGAMVTKDVSPWTIVAGVPAREIRKIDPRSRSQLLRHFGLADEGAE